MSVAAPNGRTTLVAGPLTLDLDDGGLRYVRLGSREILRRVYVAVRDGRWVTIPMTVTSLDLQERENAFTVALTAEHRQGPIHFRWQGAIRGDEHGTVRFEMDGEALTTFQRNRIGICTLHPIETCAGRPARVRHPDNSVEEGAFPRLVAPHQPFLNVRALSYEVEPGVVAEITFEGEVFETEDQRNWSDNSFKTYSTPLDLPAPVEVGAGTRIQQSITLRLVPEALARRPASPPAPAPIEVSFTEEAPVALPAIGATLAPRSEALTARELSRLRALRLSHLRVELVPSRDDFTAALAHAVEVAGALGVPLEPAAWVSSAGELAPFARAVQASGARLAVVHLLPLVRESTPAEHITALRQLMPGVPIAGGSNIYFTELNRGRAPASVADLLMFPNCPTVHMVDDTTVAENLAAIPWIAETARSFGGARPLGLSPVGLQRPVAPPPRFGAEETATIPRHVDVRQPSVFAAGWTACHLRQTARAGFARATYYQTTGWRGLMYGEAGPRFPAAFPSEPGLVFALYHVLADVAELPGAQVLGLRSSHPNEVDGLALRSGARTRVLLANLTVDAQTVRIPDALVGAPLRRIDRTNADLAAREPESFRDAPPLEATTRTLVLGPHELARIDAGD